MTEILAACVFFMAISPKQIKESVCFTH